MCREILNTCVRNTEEAEKASHTLDSTGSIGRGQGRGVWMMIEESELAKTFRQDEQKKVEAPGPGVPPSLASSDDPADMPSVEQRDAELVVATARSCKGQLEEYLAESQSSCSSDNTPPHVLDPEVADAAREAMKSLAKVIEATEDPSQLEEMLALNDDITALLKRATVQKRPTLSGLGIRLENGHPVAENGAALGADLQGADDDEPLTPRVDKGKGRAEPEPEPLEPVLSPTRVTLDSEDEEGEVVDSLLGQVESIVSPTDRWVRSTSVSGAKLIVIWADPEAGLRRRARCSGRAPCCLPRRRWRLNTTPKSSERRYVRLCSLLLPRLILVCASQLLEAMVERPPPRALGENFDPLAVEPTPASPVTPTVASPVESQKLPPRPYIRRVRSSSSNPGSPTIPSALAQSQEAP